MSRYCWVKRRYGVVSGLKLRERGQPKNKSLSSKHAAVEKRNWWKSGEGQSREMSPPLAVASTINLGRPVLSRLDWGEARASAIPAYLEDGTEWGCTSTRTGCPPPIVRNGYRMRGKTHENYSVTFFISVGGAAMYQDWWKEGNFLEKTKQTLEIRFVNKQMISLSLGKDMDRGFGLTGKEMARPLSPAGSFII